MSGRALGRITSSFLVILGNNQKANLGLNLKFEAKGLKVVGYSRKNDRNWEFSQKTVDLIKEYKARYPIVFQNLDDNSDGM
jgi:5'-3' exoribonuclease 1